MNLQDFLAAYDHPCSIVLLLGKRSVQHADRELLTRMGELLASKTKYLGFRSGNAQGADYYFSLGVSGIDNKRLQIIKPFADHRNSFYMNCSTMSLDDLSLLDEPEVISHSKANKKTARLVDNYVAGNRDSITMKAAFIIRDTLMVIGSNSGVAPAAVGLFFDDFNQPMRGGTGHTMKVCQSKGIPYFTQTDWFPWVE